MRIYSLSTRSRCHNGIGLLNGAHSNSKPHLGRPAWFLYIHWKTNDRNKGSLTLTGSADSRVNAMRNRYNIIKQVILRNDHFSPSTIPSRDREHLLTVGGSPGNVQSCWF